MKILEISASAIQSFEYCGLKWFFDTQGEPPDTSYPWAFLGTAAHTCVEYYHNNAVMPEFSAVLDAVLEDITSEGKKISWLSNGKLLDRGKTVDHFNEGLESYAEHEADLIPGKVIAVEEHFQSTWHIPTADTLIVAHGTFDQLRELPDGSRYILDLKTGSAKPTPHSVIRSSQLMFYSFFAQHHFTVGHGEVKPLIAPPAKIQLEGFIPYKRDGKAGTVKGELKPFAFVQGDLPASVYTKALNDSIIKHLHDLMEDMALQRFHRTAQSDWLCKNCDKAACLNHLFPNETTTKLYL